MWKDIFYFTRSERRALALLIVVTISIWGGVLLYTEWSEPAWEPAGGDGLQEYNDFIASLQERDNLRRARWTHPEEEQTVVLVPFDPNTADSAAFVRLGLQPYIAKNILRYRAKGGKFPTPQSFAKIYGITAVQFNTLLPYIYIGDAFQKKQDTVLCARIYRKDTLRTFKYPAGTVIDLNTADTVELKKIPGIGGVIAERIITYRSRLGGFYKVEQLQEITHVSDTLNKWFSVKEQPFQRINLNRSSIERLKAHPYLNFYQAKVIVEYRKKKGKLKSLKQLQLYEEFSADDIARLKHYVCFE